MTYTYVFLFNIKYVDERFRIIFIEWTSTDRQMYHLLGDGVGLSCFTQVCFGSIPDITAFIMEAHLFCFEVGLSAESGLHVRYCKEERGDIVTQLGIRMFS